MPSVPGSAKAAKVPRSGAGTVASAIEKSRTCSS